MTSAGSAAPTPAAILELALDRPPTLGSGRLICIDGPAGSGKTTWAAGIAELARRATWCTWTTSTRAGPACRRSTPSSATCCFPWREDRPGSYRRYDWVAGEFAERVVVDPAPLLVVEGVGCGASRFDSLVTVLVWIEAPEHVRMERGIARDGDAFAPHWKQWAADEAAVFARERTRERADVHIDGAQPYPAGDTSR